MGSFHTMIHGTEQTMSPVSILFNSSFTLDEIDPHQQYTIQLCRISSSLLELWYYVENRINQYIYITHIDSFHSKDISSRWNLSPNSIQQFTIYASSRHQEAQKIIITLPHDKVLLFQNRLRDFMYNKP